uniref:Gypsy retrotransposon integrase-like protein 1 n=1 Tax=Leptobrachium leishanense TaxID=445787 RepID=A0A8C5M5M4_9ANUR
MDPADVLDAIASLTRQVTVLSHSVQDLQLTQAQMQGQVQNLLPISSSSQNEDMISPEPRIPMPERFSGRRESYRGFLMSCEILFALNPRTYQSDFVRIRTVISLFSDEAQVWAHNLLRTADPVLQSWNSFLSAMNQLYEDPQRSDFAQAQIRQLRQGRRPIEDYTIEFRRLASETGWNETALVSQFRWGLSESVKDELARGETPTSLEPLIRLVLQIDRRIRERVRERTLFSPPPRPPAPRMLAPSPLPTTSTIPSTEEPMQLNVVRRRLTPQENQHRRDNGLCLYCGKNTHLVRDCPDTPTKGGMATCCPSTILSTSMSSVQSPHLLVQLVLQWEEKSITVEAMIDSGASNCFIDTALVSKFSIPVLNKDVPVHIQVVDGSSLGAGPVTKETIPLSSTLGPSHRELLSYDVITSPVFPIILGLPWLRRHDPIIRWSSGQLLFPSLHCRKVCLREITTTLCSILDLHKTPSNVTLPQVYQSFKDVFDERGVDALPPHRPYDCPIDLLPGAPIPYGRLYPLSEPELVILKEYIDENLAKGFIRPSTSPAGAGIFFVAKKDGGLRPCVDYRALNNITIKNRYPLPLISELMDRLKTATIFSKLDLKGAYNLIRVKEGDEWKTAFRSRYGHFEYTVMPYGLCNAPATFQCFINVVFRDMLDQCVVIYLDDILVYSSTLEEHRKHMQQVLQRLRQHHLFAKLDKCLFEVHTVEFLGFVIRPGTIAMDDKKIQAIKQWPIPLNRKQVQRFLGFANFYRKFIRNFSRLAQPLTALTKSTVPFQWSTNATQAFNDLRERFCSAPILFHPNPSLAYYLEVDASNNATGAVLSQRCPTTNNLHPIAFFSKKMSPAECNYDIGDKELLAIKQALEEWRHILEGCLHPITIYTDHKNLEYLKSAKRLRPRQARWALFFSRFQFHLTFRPGSRNGKADALSRLHEYHSGRVKTEETILQPHQFLSVTSRLLNEIAQTNVPSPTSTVPPKDRILVPKEKQLHILQQCHDSPLAGHAGRTKTRKLISRHFWWSSLSRDVRDYVKSCDVCARAKTLPQKPLGLLQPLPVPETPWSHVTMDFIVDLPPSAGHTCIMVIVDRLTKLAHFIPSMKIPTAKETASLFIAQVFRLHGIPTSIVTDRGTQFTSHFWKAFCSSLQISVDLSTSYHPQSNGQTERTNQTLESYLRCYSSYQQNNWLELLPMAEFSYNSHTHESTTFSPFFLTYGYHPAMFPGLPSYTSVPDATTRLRLLADGLAKAKDALHYSQARYKRHADQSRATSPTYLPGQKVWLSTRFLQLSCPSRKLGPRYIGPFIVVEHVNAVAVRLRLPPRYSFHPVVHSSLLKPCHANPFPGRSRAPPPPVLVDGAKEYVVGAILDSRRRRGVLEYLVHWKGYGPDEDSWVSSSDVHAPRLVRSFHISFPAKPGPRRPRSLRLGGGVLSRRHTHRGTVRAAAVAWRVPAVLASDQVPLGDPLGAGSLPRRSPMEASGRGAWSAAWAGGPAMLWRLPQPVGGGA